MSNFEISLLPTWLCYQFYGLGSILVDSLKFVIFSKCLHLCNFLYWSRFWTDSTHISFCYFSPSPIFPFLNTFFVSTIKVYETSRTRKLYSSFPSIFHVCMHMCLVHSVLFHSYMHFSGWLIPLGALYTQKTNVCREYAYSWKRRREACVFLIHVHIRRVAKRLICYFLVRFFFSFY